MRLSVGSDSTLSVSTGDLRWTQRTLFRSPRVRITELECRPDVLGCQCDKCAIDHQFVFVRRGGFLKHARGETFVANANKVVFFKAWEPYRTEHFSLEGDDCTVISLHEDCLDEVLGGGTVMPISHLPSSLEIVGRGQALAARVKAGLADPLEVEEEALSLVHKFGARPSRDTATRNGRSETIVRRVEALRTVEFASPWTLGELARRVGRSQFHLVRVFRRVTGMPIHRYLTNLRLSAALERLASGEGNLAMLALDLGFSSHAHFSATFKSAFGVAPTAMRAELLGAVHPRDR